MKIKSKKSWVIGAAKDGKVVFAMATAYGMPIFCYEDVNVYYTINALTKAFDEAKAAMAKEYKNNDKVKGLRLFIVKSCSSKNPFKFKSPGEVAVGTWVERGIRVRAKIESIK